MYDITQEECAAAGMPRYEVSNHAAPGQESIYNQVIGNMATISALAPVLWSNNNTSGRYGTETHLARNLENSVMKEKTEFLDTFIRRNQLSEFVLMGMRMSSGISVHRLNELSNGSFKRQVK